MAKQLFPDVEELLDILFAELPEGVYPDDRADDPDPEGRSVSSSELRAQVSVLAGIYANLEEVNADKHLTTLTLGGMNAAEKEFFATAQDANQPEMLRRQNLIAKKRATGSISLPAIRSIIAGILDPVGLPFKILPYSGQSNGDEQGAWVLGVSELGLDTWLAKMDPLRGATRDPDLSSIDCDFDYAAAGLTAEELTAMQETAYLYEVRIYGTASEAILRLLDQQLTQFEPARSSHIITNNAPLTQDPTTYGWSTAFLPWWTS